jgi:hypothetical protein
MLLCVCVFAPTLPSPEMDLGDGEGALRHARAALNRVAKRLAKRWFSVGGLNLASFSYRIQVT